jgi:beta-1,3-galactosyl-O-glycosyl-glycoprotein beta-1,6-N-acetylglucosaminyltransferase
VANRSIHPTITFPGTKYGKNPKETLAKVSEKNHLQIRPSPIPGKLVKESCVFGIGDLPILLKRPELIAHKIYLDYQPAGLLNRNISH